MNFSRMVIKGNQTGINFFEKYLTLFVLLFMVIGVSIGVMFPIVPTVLNQFEIYSVNIPIALLIWLMIFPMMLKIDFTSVKKVSQNPRGLILTWVVNWLIKPFTMFAIAWLFFYGVFQFFIDGQLAKDYIIGAVLLGAAPCTAMVFVWSSLTRGNPAYTLIQVATNDLLILILFTPIVGFLIGMTGITVPWITLIISVMIFVVLPLIAASILRLYVIKHYGLSYYNQQFIAKFKHLTVIGLLLTLVLIFSLQSDLIIQNPLHIVLIAIPLIIQTILIFFIAYGGAKLLKLSYEIAAPAGMIGASNFFELAVAVAIALFPLNPGVALVTIVGVLTEVPVMLMLVKFANKTQHWFPALNQKQGSP
jgi:ACR3 family arsenite transporter